MFKLGFNPKYKTSCIINRFDNMAQIKLQDSFKFNKKGIIETIMPFFVFKKI